MMITVGADPEFFFKDSRTSQVVPAVGTIGGTKEKPIPIPDLGRGFAMQEDNVMAEYNIPAAEDSAQFARSIVGGWRGVALYVQSKHPHMVPDVGACARLFTDEQLNNSQAMTFGCSRDFNAYEQGRALPSPDPNYLKDEGGAWRFAGGHIHLGIKRKDPVPDFVIAQFADVYLGLPSVVLDKQEKRRELYGSAGRYRPTEWGIEYRTLSNFWVWDESLANQIGARAFNMGYYLESVSIDDLQTTFAEVPWPDVQKAINKEDEEMAADLIAYLSQDLRLGV